MSAPFVPIIVRASSLNGWGDCPRRSAARIFRREIEAAGYKLRQLPRSIGALVGTAVHKGAAHELNQKARTGRLPKVSVPVDVAVGELDEQLALGEVAFDSPKRGITLNRGEAIHQTANMTRAYHTTIAPQVQPIHVEQRLEAEIGGIILSGQSDMVCREPGSLRDLKTGSRPPSSVSPQIGAYSLLNRSHGTSIETASIDFVQRVSERKAQPDPVTTTIELAHAETAAVMVLRHIEHAINTFRHGDPERRILPGDSWAFLPNPSSVLCSAKWCPAHGTEFCHEGKQKSD